MSLLTQPTNKQLLMARDRSGAVTYGLFNAQLKWSTTLAANVAQSFTLPTEYPMYWVSFSNQVGTDIWVDAINAAALPGNSFSTTTAELNPGPRVYDKGQTLSFITGNTSAELGVIVYAFSNTAI